MGNGSGGADASVLFNLDGFNVVAQTQTMHNGEWWLLIETSQIRSDAGGVPVVRGDRRRERPPPGAGSRSPDRRDAGGVGVGQTHPPLPRTVVRAPRTLRPRPSHRTPDRPAARAAASGHLKEPTRLCSERKGNMKML
jgi:hypothetical protein